MLWHDYPAVSITFAAAETDILFSLIHNTMKNRLAIAVLAFFGMPLHA